MNTPFRALLEKTDSEINLLEAYRQGKIVYFGLDMQSYQSTAARIGRVITQDVNTLSGWIESQLPASEKKTLAIYIDEYQAFGTSSFTNALARGRSSGLWVTLAHQSLGDLKAISPAHCQQVLENTNTKVFFRVNDPESAQVFADSIGRRTVTEASRQIVIKGSAPQRLLGTEREARQYALFPDDLKSLATGEAAFKAAGRFGRLELLGIFGGSEQLDFPFAEKPANEEKPVKEVIIL